MVYKSSYKTISGTPISQVAQKGEFVSYLSIENGGHSHTPLKGPILLPAHVKHIPFDSHVRQVISHF